jgi:hypothetical protein
MLHLEMDYEQCVLDFPVDPEGSSIEGVILADEPDCVYWSIDILTQDIPYSEEDREELEIEEGELREGCRLQISGLAIPVASWRDLEGKRIEVAYEAEEVHPILPGGPGIFLIAGQYHVPNSNRITFGKRVGGCFGVAWSCVAEGYAGETGTRIAVNTHLPLRRIRVYFRDPGRLSIELAREMIHRVAEEIDLGSPDTSRPDCVYLPVRSEAR